MRHYQGASLLVITILLFKIAVAQPPPHNGNNLNPSNNFFMGHIIHTLGKAQNHPIYQSVSDSYIDDTCHAPHSGNLNQLGFVRNGHGVKITNQGLKIGIDGFLYERLAPGFSNWINMQGKAFKIQYTCPIDRTVTFTLFQSYNLNFAPGTLDLRALHAYEECKAGEKVLLVIPVKRFLVQDKTARIVALRIDGPCTVQSIDILNPKVGKRFGNRSVDKCNSWKDPFVDGKRVMFSPKEPYRIYSNTLLNVNFGGGGETMDMMNHPFNTIKNYAFQITYTAKRNGKRCVQVMYEIQSDNAIHTASLSDKFHFETGHDRIFLLRMDNVKRVSGIIIYGPLIVHSIEIISLLPHGFVQSGYNNPDDDFGISDPDFQLPDFDFNG